MKIQVDKFKNWKIVLYTFIACSLYACILFLMTAFIERDVNKPIYFTPINGIIESIEEDVQDEVLFIKLKEYDNIFTGNLDKEQVQRFSETIELNAYLELIVSEKRIDKNKTPIIKATYEGKTILDLEEDYLKTADSLVLASGISCGIALVIITVVIILKRKEKVKFVDYFEHFLPIWSYDFIFKNNRSFKEIEKKNNIIVFCYLGFIFILTILIVIFGNMFPDYPHIIIPIVVVLFSLATILLFKYIIGQRSTKDDIKEFVELYLKYLNEDICLEEEEAINFTDDCLIIEDYRLDEENPILKTSITYEELDFYVACVYKNSFHQAHIYICSDYNENLDYPICFKLNAVIYQQIKKHDIKVKNLDYLINNLESEIIKNKPKFKTKLVKYK